MKTPPVNLSRRRFVAGLASSSVLAACGALLPAYARAATWGVAGPLSLRPAGEPIDLRVHRQDVAIGQRIGRMVALNGSTPGPLLRLNEGEDLTIRVHNTLTEDTSIHWHGLLLPFQMDGVPGVSFPGIPPGTTFSYRFPVRQSGTYWYHSHSGMQEQLGLYGPIIIDPAGEDPVAFDREHVIVLSDWMFDNPHHVMAKLKKQSDFDNLRVHHSKPVKAWVEERKDKIELFYLPSYSPELNPEERLNADLKQAIYTKVPVRTKAKLKTAATEHMQALENSPERVK